MPFGCRGMTALGGIPDGQVLDSNCGRLPFGRPRDIADPTHPSLPRIAMIASFNIKE